jgi:hypothetical protein
MFINRDFSRTEADDWSLNVQPLMDPRDGAQKIYSDGECVGWVIKPLFE